MGFLKKYYRRVEKGYAATQWSAIELADEEIDELWKKVKNLEKEISYLREEEKEVRDIAEDNNVKIDTIEDRVNDIEERLDRLEQIVEEEWG